MSAVDCIISSFRRAFDCVGRAFWRIVRPAPQLIIFLHMPSRIRRRELFLAPVPAEIYDQVVPAVSEDIGTISPAANNDDLYQEIDTGEIENQHRVLVHNSAEAEPATEDEYIYDTVTYQ